MNKSSGEFIKSRSIVIGVGIVATICLADFIISMLPNIGDETDSSAIVTQELNTRSGTEDNDRLLGTEDKDKLVGQAGNDELLGEGDNDALIGGAGSDRLDGGAGIDVAIYENSTAVTVDLSLGTGKEGSDTDTLVAVENIIGSQYSDRLGGNDEANSLTGGDGADLLVGKGGDDLILGGEDEDILEGGEGQDTFLYLNFDEGVDRIKDFEVGVDRIKLFTEGFGTQFAAGTLPAKYFIEGTKAIAAEQHFIYDRTSGNLYFDLDGNDTIEPVLIITFDGSPALSAKDISLF